MVLLHLSRSERTALLVVLLAAVLLRGGFALLARSHDSNLSAWGPLRSEVVFLRSGLHSSDTQEYLALASGIASGLFGWDGRPSAWRMPGYPTFLFLMGRSTLLVLLVQVLLGGATVALAWLGARRAAGPGVALAAAAVLAVDAGSVLMTGVLLAETLFTFLLVLGWYLLACQREAVAGVALGMAALVRPVGMVLLLPFAALLLVRREWRRAGFFCLAFLILPGGWAARNLIRFGAPALSTDGAFNLYYTCAGTLLQRQTGLDEETARASLAAELGTHSETGNPVLLSRQMSRLALHRILADPGRYALIHLAGAGRVLVGVQSDDVLLRLRGTGERPEMPGFPALRRDPLLLLLAAGEMLLVVLAFGASLAAVILRRAGWLARLTFLSGFLLILAAAPLTSGRLRVPAMPFFCLAAALALRRQTAG